MGDLQGASSVRGRKQPVVNILKNDAPPSLSGKNFDGRAEFSKHLRNRTEPEWASTVLISVSCEVKREELTIVWLYEQVMQGVGEVNRSNPSVWRNGVSNGLRSVHTKFMYNEKRIQFGHIQDESPGAFRLWTQEDDVKETSPYRGHRLNDMFLEKYCNHVCEA